MLKSEEAWNWQRNERHICSWLLDVDTKENVRKKVVYVSKNWQCAKQEKNKCRLISFLYCHHGCPPWWNQIEKCLGIELPWLSLWIFATKFEKCFLDWSLQIDFSFANTRLHFIHTHNQSFIFFLFSWALDYIRLWISLSVKRFFS